MVTYPLVTAAVVRCAAVHVERLRGLKRYRVQDQHDEEHAAETEAEHAGEMAFARIHLMPSWEGTPASAGAR